MVCPTKFCPRLSIFQEKKLKWGDCILYKIKNKTKETKEPGKKRRSGKLTPLDVGMSLFSEVHFKKGK